MILLILLTVSISFATAQNNVSLQEKVNWLMKDVARLSKEIATNGPVCASINEGTCGPCRCRDSKDIFKKFYCDCTNLNPERDCKAFRDNGASIDGLYMIHQNNLKVIKVYCDQTTDGGGWVVFQRRANGTTKFYRDWYNYKIGFGDLLQDFWLGNEQLSTLSYQSFLKGSELRIDLQEFSNKRSYAQYSNFQIGNELSKYTLHVSGYSGTARDSFSFHNGKRFSTYDSKINHCPLTCQAAWWYGACYASSLNGRYYQYGEAVSRYRGMHWKGIGDGEHVSLKFVEMKIRRKV